MQGYEQGGARRYVQKLTSENEVPKAFEFKTFDKIKEESNDKDKNTIN